MDLSTIKLIVTDMDGTLLNSKGEVSTRFFQLFKKLQENNIQFVAASGRQYYSIIEKLAPIKDDIIVIAENGGITKQAEKELNTYLLQKDSAKELINFLRTLEGAEIVLCGKKQAYIESGNQDFIDFFKEFYTKYKKIDDLLKVEDDEFFKIAVYHPHSSEAYLYPHSKHLEGQLQVKVSGNKWMDLSSLDAHKGNALEALQTKLDITKAETMVFGDYNNDIEMLNLADFSFAMENAHPNVKKIAKFSTKTNDENGVEFILEQLLAGR